MFEGWQRWRHILVTGPQRSGTTICARMVAADTGHQYIDEDEFGISSSARLFRLLKEAQGCVVVQCPGLAHIVDLFTGDDTLIVFMRRSLMDIAASQDRLGWWNDKPLRAELAKYSETGGDINRLKYERWAWQRHNIPHWREVDYESLAEHPLWVPKERRVGWGSRQWNL